MGLIRATEAYECPQGPANSVGVEEIHQVVEPRPVFVALVGALRDRAGPTWAILPPGAEAGQAPLPREPILGGRLGGTGMACGCEGRYLGLGNRVLGVVGF